MSAHTVTVRWQRGAVPFIDNKYSRAHTWSFDGGVEVPASSSPSVVPLPYSVAQAVDPEEAFVASLSSCHMLWFLSIAAMHHAAHAECFIANSVTTDVRVEPGTDNSGSRG